LLLLQISSDLKLCIQYQVMDRISPRSMLLEEVPFSDYADAFKRWTGEERRPEQGHAYARIATPLYFDDARRLAAAFASTPETRVIAFDDGMQWHIREKGSVNPVSISEEINHVCVFVRSLSSPEDSLDRIYFRRVDSSFYSFIAETSPDNFSAYKWRNPSRGLNEKPVHAVFQRNGVEPAAIPELDVSVPQKPRVRKESLTVKSPPVEKSAIMSSAHVPYRSRIVLSNCDANDYVKWTDRWFRNVMIPEDDAYACRINSAIKFESFEDLFSAAFSEPGISIGFRRQHNWQNFTPHNAEGLMDYFRGYLLNVEPPIVSILFPSDHEGGAEILFFRQDGKSVVNFGARIPLARLDHYTSRINIPSGFRFVRGIYIPDERDN